MIYFHLNLLAHRRLHLYHLHLSKIMIANYHHYPIHSNHHYHRSMIPSSFNDSISESSSSIVFQDHHLIIIMMVEKYESNHVVRTAIHSSFYVNWCDLLIFEWSYVCVLILAVKIAFWYSDICIRCSSVSNAFYMVWFANKWYIFINFILCRVNWIKFFIIILCTWIF